MEDWKEEKRKNGWNNNEIQNVVQNNQNPNSKNIRRHYGKIIGILGIFLFAAFVFGTESKCVGISGDINSVEHHQDRSTHYITDFGASNWYFGTPSMNTTLINDEGRTISTFEINESNNRRVTMVYDQVVFENQDCSYERTVNV